MMFFFSPIMRFHSFHKTLAKKLRKIVSRTCARAALEEILFAAERAPKYSASIPRLVLEKNHSTCLHKFTGASEHVSVITCVEKSMPIRGGGLLRPCAVHP